MPRRTDLKRVLVHRLRADRHRAGVRVRLLGHAGVQGAARRRARGRAGQQQPGDDHDRPGAGRPHLRRAAARRTLLEAIIERERPDALLPTVGGQTALNLAVALAEARRAREVRRRADRRVGRGDQGGGGPAQVPRRDARRSASTCRESGLRAVAGRGAGRSSRTLGFPLDHPAVVHAGRRRRRHRLQHRGVPRDRASAASR